MALSWGKVIFGGLVVALGAYLTWPGQGILDYRSCKPKPVFPIVSELLYRRYFWEEALRQTREATAYWEREGPEFTKMFDSSKAIGEREEIYRKYPDMAPSASERAAQALRDQADQIEANEAANKLRAMFERNARETRQCEQLIEDKLRSM